MKYKGILTLLARCIIIVAITASVMGIFSTGGPGAFQYRSIRGKEINIWGKGLYRDMSAEVAPQGIAQDYVTLFIAIPLLMYSLLRMRSGALKERLLLTGVLGYFMVTYLFYLAMGMYNILFLAYVFLTSASFFAFLCAITSIPTEPLVRLFRPDTPVKALGGFLVFNAVTIALLWLGIVVPPLIDGSIIPVQTEHYTTLIVQGLDLSILLPAAFIAGILLIRKKPLGYLLGTVYLVFLSVLMTALSAKVAAIAFLGYNVIPVIFIIPVFNVTTIICVIIIFKKIHEVTLAHKP